MLSLGRFPAKQDFSFVLYATTSTSVPTKGKRKPMSSFVCPMGCSRAEACCLGRYLTVFSRSPVLTCISNSYVTEEMTNFCSIPVTEDFPVGHREKVLSLSDLRRPMSPVSMLESVVQEICPWRVYMYICVKTHILYSQFVCFQGAVEFNCLLLTGRISYFPVLLHPPFVSFLSVTVTLLSLSDSLSLPVSSLLFCAQVVLSFFNLSFDFF